ncbi:nuclear transport factor 2 family protein [Paraburkholderia nemoris]|jgi:predicted SnoaL-like aldol condensation-catalyzing enzyme|uniref:nuclear transport factor 2 family protein n=1 Tax=Paraburkholderia TaxID=1822464 RepID=UPI002259BFD0|nr:MULTISPECIES: nuclear transport factor 2 family protein [Paraburkholderia]MCX4140673.1 nuclear transport factor 2 family protein [Paraburkholderia aspalathi]MDN7173358.1 nuclear transport factor 2 family protein [Paraburkholderia sp. SEWSISQ10-3 4]MDQ6502999.1 nuclear transport factor 2 family protein [Paraburkholderia aspalathi]
MSDFTIVDGVAQIHNPELYNTWLDRPDYIEALAASPSPEVTAIKRLLIEFEAELSRMVRDNTVQEKVVEVMTRFIADDYIQHDPNAPGNGRERLIEHFRRVPLAGVTPPPVVSVIVEGELGTVMFKEPTPDPTAPGQTYDWYMITVFRVRNGKLAEHWSTFKKMADPFPPKKD